MTFRSFVDTNVWVYAIDVGEPEKRAVARRLLAQAAAGSFVISTQVLQEFYVVATRKLSIPLTEARAQTHVERMSDLPVVPTDKQLVHDAIRISRDAHLSLWDALLIAAASTSGCTRLLTEDLSPGAEIEGVTVHNPFAPS